MHRNAMDSFERQFWIGSGTQPYGIYGMYGICGVCNVFVSHPSHEKAVVLQQISPSCPGIKFPVRVNPSLRPGGLIIINLGHCWATDNNRFSGLKWSSNHWWMWNCNEAVLSSMRNCQSWWHTHLYIHQSSVISGGRQLYVHQWSIISDPASVMHHQWSVISDPHGYGASKHDYGASEDDCGASQHDYGASEHDYGVFGVGLPRTGCFASGICLALGSGMFWLCFCSR